MEGQTQLLEFLHLIGDLQRTIHRGFTQTVADCPKCHFSMLQRLHFSIEKCGRDGAIYVSELTRFWRVAPSAISRDLRILEQDGYIERTTDPADRRKTLVRFTPEGESIREKCSSAVDAYLQAVLTRMGEENVRRLSLDFQTAIQAMDEETATLVKGHSSHSVQKGDSSC